MLAAILVGWPLLLSPARSMPHPPQGDSGGDDRGADGSDPVLAEESPSEAAVAAPAPRLRRARYPLFLRPLAGQEPVEVATDRGVRELVLTFDDGPDLFGTPAVLAELGRRGLKAIFFVNGEHMVGRRPEDFARRELIRRMAAQGHMVANHTLSHRNVCREEELLDQQIDGNAEIITAATGVRPLLFRSPYGARCRRLDRALATRELVQVGWSLDPQEWKGADEEAIVADVTRGLARLRGQAILLLHDTQRAAVHALPRILDWIDRENQRAARTGGAPIRIRDYSALLPTAPLPDHGLEPFWSLITDTLTALPGLPAARTRLAVRPTR
jgi:peptidoglycan-N-acetylglucosamine deacetylase